MLRCGGRGREEGERERGKEQVGGEGERGRERERKRGSGIRRLMLNLPDVVDQLSGVVCRHRLNVLTACLVDSLAGQG